MEAPDSTPIEKKCETLLTELLDYQEDDKSVADFRKIAPEFFERHGRSIKDGSMVTFFSQIRHRNFQSKMATQKFYDILSEMLVDVKKKDLKNEYNSTIIFYYWSEGLENHRDIDDLKIAYISFNLEDLKIVKSKKCLLVYKEKSPKAGQLKKLADDDIISFQFENGTSLLMHFADPKGYRKAFYKGTYISSPHKKIACGTALFEIRDINTKYVMNEAIDFIKRGQIMAELYKKRFLITTDNLSDITRFRTNGSYNELSNLDHYYLRYRKSNTDEKIHADLIKIEPFGRVVYFGEESIAVHGRCFIQKKNNNPLMKNLIIELYQQNDTDQQAFELRYPHSFMMFELTDNKEIVGGYLIKPRKDYQPESMYCILIRADLDETMFNYKNFTFETSIDTVSKIKKFHKFSADNNALFDKEFQHLLYFKKN